MIAGSSTAGVPGKYTYAPSFIRHMFVIGSRYASAAFPRLHAGPPAPPAQRMVAGAAAALHPRARPRGRTGRGGEIARADAAIGLPAEAKGRGGELCRGLGCGAGVRTAGGGRAARGAARAR